MRLGAYMKLNLGGLFKSLHYILRPAIAVVFFCCAILSISRGERKKKLYKQTEKNIKA